MTIHPSEMKHTRWASIHRLLCDDYGTEFSHLTLAAQGMVIGDVCSYLESGGEYDAWKEALAVGFPSAGLRGCAMSIVDMHQAWGVEA